MSTARKSVLPPGDSVRDAEALHAAAIHLLRKLRRTDTQISGQSGAPSNAGRARSASSWTANPARLSALSVIVFSGSITLGRLAEAEQVRPPTMTRIVHALLAQGLVTKTGDPADRRTIRIAATLQGKRLMLQGRNRRLHALAAQIAALPPGEQSILLRALAVLAKLTEAL
jgi:DNA-binding MarR family transcriptional regulator